MSSIGSGKQAVFRSMAASFVQLWSVQKGSAGELITLSPTTFHAIGRIP